MPKSKTAILIFARSIKEELKHKPFLAQNSIIEALHNHTINTAQQSGLPVIIYDETTQVGCNFGERFTNAIAHVFDKGYSNIITIGNDCPQLKVAHITEAEKAILNKKASIGSTFDGGFYLLGISKEKFDRHTFLNFNWGTKTLYREIVYYFKSDLLEYAILPRLRDIDFYADLERLHLQTVKDANLRKIISSIINKDSTILFSNKLKALLLPKYIVFNKGSPLAYSL